MIIAFNFIFRKVAMSSTRRIIMKQVMHQVSMHRTYITTEAMTTTHVQVFYVVYSATQVSTVASQ